MHRFVPRPNPKVAVAATSSVAVAAALAATLVTGGSPAVASTHHYFAYGGNAFGSRVALGTLANVGRTAYVPMCTTRSGVTHANKTAKIDLGAVGYIGAATSKLHSQHKGSVARSTASTHTAHTSLLTGMIALRAVTTQATVARGTHYSTGGDATFLGLRIAGRAMPATPKANTTLALPGLGSVTLNEQHAGVHDGIPTKTVIALDLVLGSNNSLGLPAGRVIIGKSTASLRQTHRVPTAAAWATQISVSTVVGSGRTAAAYTGCGGTGTSGHSNDLTGVLVPNGVANAGVARSTVHTTDGAKKTTSSARNRITGVSLLNGMIKAKVLTTQANAASSGGRHTSNAKGTTVLGLVVGGKAMAAPRTGQHRSIPGLGVLSFGYAHRTKRGITVYGLRLKLGSAHNGVPAGAVITVGAAKANVLG